MLSNTVIWRKQRIVLKHKTDFTLTRVQAANVRTVETNMAAGLMFPARQYAQQRRLPEPELANKATIWPEGISSEISFST